MDIAKMRQRLGEISNKNKRTNNSWKPSEGTQNIRLVPCKEQPDNPFIELKFHYGFNGKTYLSPTSFGRPDPIVEIANKLRNSGDKDDFELSKQFYPKMRIYAPVIVRGEEDKGVRFWGFGKQVYQTLLGIVADEEYGDITDLKNGTDITVEYISAEAAGKNFPETQIRPRRKPSVVGDKDVIEAIKNQSPISDIYGEEPSYETLKAALDAYLNPEGEGTEDSDDETETSSETKVEEKSAVEEKTEVKASSKDVENDFDKLFNN